MVESDPGSARSRPTCKFRMIELETVDGRSVARLTLSIGHFRKIEIGAVMFAMAGRAGDEEADGGPAPGQSVRPPHIEKGPHKPLGSFQFN